MTTPLTHEQIEELRPCPFCGCPAEYESIFGRLGTQCSNCGIGYRPISMGEEAQRKESTEVWNTRTLLSSLHTSPDTEYELRKLLWLRHNSDHSLYGDDGELQCSTCRMDFKRMTPEEMKAEFRKQGVAALTAASEQEQEKSDG